MSRSLVPVVVVTAALFGFGRVAYADDVCPAPVLGPNFCTVTGSIANGQGQFTLPQFSTPLGRVIVSPLSFNYSSAFSGTVTVSYTCPPFQNGREPFCDYGIESLTAVVSSAQGSPIPFLIDSDPEFTSWEGPLTCAGNPNGQTCTTPISWSAFPFGGVIGQNLSQEALTSLFTGTGELTFRFMESITNLEVAGEAVGISFDPSSFYVSFAYGVVPAVVPEPSLAAVTAAIFGLIVWRRQHRRRPAHHSSARRALLAAEQRSRRP
jgi:hypothetical protein